MPQYKKTLAFLKSIAARNNRRMDYLIFFNNYEPAIDPIITFYACRFQRTEHYGDLTGKKDSNFIKILIDYRE